MSIFNFLVIADTSNPIPLALLRRWGVNSNNFIVWNPKYNTDIPSDAIFLVFEPYLNDDIFQSIGVLWKKFLAKPDSPQNSRLIILGTAEASAPNYCDLLNLPDDPSALFANALPATAAWEPVSSGGMDMQEKLMRFLDGHSYLHKDQNAKEFFIRMRKGLLAYKDGISDKIEPIEYFRQRIFQEDTFVQLQTFLARWERYFPLFDALPFFTIFVAIEKEIKMLEALFQSPPTDQALTNWIDQAVHHADTIKDALDKIENYVRD